jgi:hypothetical protein
MGSRRPVRPATGKAVAVAAVLSLLLPGLGHVYIGRFARSLIWFGGSLLISGVLREGDPALWLPLAMFGAIGVFAAADSWLLIGSRSRQG